jgi:nucleoside-diphosphate-sugar epimerase
MGIKLIVGCGYLGKRVAQRWREAGHRVFATTRKLGRFEELTALGVEPILCDVLDPKTLRDLPPVQSALCCVALDRSTGVAMRTLYVDGLANVLEGVGPDARFVHVSSSGVYGQTGGEEVDESALTDPPDESGQVMLEAERLLRARRPEAVVLRFAGIYGPGRLLRAQALKAGDPIAGDPDRWLNLIHVEDGATAVVAAESAGEEGEVVNVADDRPARRREFYERLAALLGAPAVRFVPFPEGQPVPAGERVNRRVSNRKLREELGVELRYPSFEVGLPAAVGKG